MAQTLSTGWATPTGGPGGVSIFRKPLAAFARGGDIARCRVPSTAAVRFESSTGPMGIPAPPRRGDRPASYPPVYNDVLYTSARSRLHRPENRDERPDSH